MLDGDDISDLRDVDHTKLWLNRMGLIFLATMQGVSKGDAEHGIWSPLSKTDFCIGIWSCCKSSLITDVDALRNLFQTP